MSRYRPVDTRLWNDRKFLELDSDGRLLWCLLLTAPSTLPIPGVILGGEGTLSEQLGWSVELFRAVFGTLLAKHLSVKHEGRVFWLTNALKYQPPKNPNMIKGWSKTWDDIPEGLLKLEIWEALRIACKPWAKLFDGLFRKPTGEQTDPLFLKQKHQEQEQEQEQEREEADHSLSVVKPLPPEHQELAPVRTRTHAVSPDPKRGQLARMAWNLAAVTHAELKTSGVDREAPPWQVQPDSSNRGWKALLERVGELLLEYEPSRVDQILRHRIANAKQEAVKRRDLKYFIPAFMWNEKSFDIGAAWSLDATRNGPKPAEQPELKCTLGDEEAS